MNQSEILECWERFKHGKHSLHASSETDLRWKELTNAIPSMMEIIKSKVMVTTHSWKDHQPTITTPMKCILCDEPAAVVCYAPEGCTCSPNKIQPRCYHHLMRAYDSMENITIIEDFIIPNKGDEFTT